MTEGSYLDKLAEMSDNSSPFFSMNLETPIFN